VISDDLLRRSRIVPKAMFYIDELPDMVFVDPSGSERHLRLQSQGDAIASVAGCLRDMCAPGDPVGLLFSAEPNLVINWLACLAAGVRPLILQYPNAKQNYRYWSDSISNTLELVGINVLIVDSPQKLVGVRGSFRVIEQSTLDNLAPADGIRLDFSQCEILQLSSGTTGFRKAIGFRSDALLRHVQDFNSVLGLTKSDVIVSWLPLYHDMGFIACFVMPLMLGVKIVMMDPLTWVRRPALLNDAIERHSGTICYMPNFGFEVMTRTPASTAPTMRAWISCSEPIAATIALKFLEHVGAEPQCFWPCYAMAENIFAVSLGLGVRLETVNSTEVVSCGRAILNVDVRIHDGEIWVRSPVSLHQYIGGKDIRDDEGFYPTGDLGEIIDGDLFVSGRKLDVLIQAGRKFLLSDLDIRVNELLPSTRGRVATVASRDERIGTEVAIVLAEAIDFYARDDHAVLEAELKATAGIDPITVKFVPPRFLTKTTSGKINRKKSFIDWRAAQADRVEQKGGSTIDPVHEMESTFRGVSWANPVSGVLDSLSRTVLHMLTADYGIAILGEDTLEVIREKLRKVVGSGPMRPGTQGLRIVSIAERLLFDRIDEKSLDVLEEMLGIPVSFEHVCLPPSAVLLSDIVFADYFLPRVDSEDFAAVRSALAKVRNASLIIVDDASEMFYPPEQVYGVLSHNLERDPRADLISVRWQTYTQMHDRLPITLVRGGDIAIPFQHVGRPFWRTKNLETFGDKFAHLNTHGSMEGHPESGCDWFHVDELKWRRNQDEWMKVRTASGRGELA
jgi:acyl-CoA synthetase (AMP-forming)/AMP-acid ligase II